MLNPVTSPPTMIVVPDFFQIVSFANVIAVNLLAGMYDVLPNVIFLFLVGLIVGAIAGILRNL